MTSTLELMVPYYGDPSLLRECLASLCAQSDPAWRATVLDDRYPGADAAAIAAAFQDERISVVRNERNLGANANYREAIRRASADLVVVMGADDRLGEHYVREVRAAADDTGADIVQPGVRVIDENGREHRPLVDLVKRWLTPRVHAAGNGRRVVRGESAAARLLLGDWMYFPSLCWRRTTLQAVTMRDYHVVQDLGMILDVVLGGGSIVAFSEPVFEYRRHRGSDSAVRSLTGERFDEERRLARELEDELSRVGWRSAVLAARIRPTSRAHALITALQVRAADPGAARRLVRYAAS
jgi:glycosyltransferase involved in cell wall biosynthesis